MSDSPEQHDRRPTDPPDNAKGHPSQAEGEDAEHGEHRDPLLNGHPSQAEGADPEDGRDD